MESTLTVAFVTILIVTVFTLLFQYFPGLRVTWAGLQTEVKSLIVLGLYLAVGAIVAFGGCVPALLVVIPALLCVGVSPFITYVVATLIAVGAGQGVFSVLPELKDVAAAKAARS